MLQGTLKLLPPDLVPDVVGTVVAALPADELPELALAVLSAIPTELIAEVLRRTVQHLPPDVVSAVVAALPADELSELTAAIPSTMNVMPCNLKQLPLNVVLSLRLSTIPGVGFCSTRLSSFLIRAG